MKWFLGEYTKRFDARHKLFGHLFCARYKALVVDGSVALATAGREPAIPRLGNAGNVKNDNLIG